MSWTRRRYLPQLRDAPQVADILVLEQDRAARLPGQLDDDAAGRGLAAARLADQREDLAPEQGQVDAVHGAHDAARLGGGACP